jgi:hypothetical protein
VDGRKRRYVYKSDSPLSSIQERIGAILSGICEKELDETKVVAYMKGVNAAKVFSRNVDKKYQVQFDVKKYYDHVSYRHIKETLMDHGFQRLGAQLVSYLCTVKRTLPKTGQVINTLQQGSAASPAISNLVGYKYIDVPILEWIEGKKGQFPYAEFIYARYSDNVFLWVDYPDNKTVPIEVFKEYKQFVKDTLAKNRFWTHHWATIPNNHPKRNQRALGIVLNKRARVDKATLSTWRSTLFNACRCGMDIAARNYWNDRGRPFNPDDDEDLPEHIQDERDVERFIMVARGMVSYVGSINWEHGLQLDKLLTVAKELYECHTNRLYTGVYKTVELDNRAEWVSTFKWELDNQLEPKEVYHSRVLAPEALHILKQYKNKTESLENFKEKMCSILNAENEFSLEEEESVI